MTFPSFAGPRGPRILMILLTPLIFAAPGGSVVARNECAVPAHHHPWAQFRPGSWKLVRVRTESLAAPGEAADVSVSEIKSVLVGADAATYTLRIEQTAIVAGKRISSPARTVRLGLSGETDGQRAAVTNGDKQIVTIDGRRIEAEVRRVVIDDGETRRVTTIYYNDRLPPFVLRRDTLALDDRSRKTKYRSQMTVTSVVESQRVLERLLPASHVSTTQSWEGGQSRAAELHSPRIPGGVVSHTREVFDEAGKVVERSTLELVDYGVEGESDDGTRPTRVRTRRRMFFPFLRRFFR